MDPNKTQEQIDNFRLYGTVEIPDDDLDLDFSNLGPEPKNDENTTNQPTDKRSS